MLDIMSSSLARIALPQSVIKTGRGRSRELPPVGPIVREVPSVMTGHEPSLEDEAVAPVAEVAASPGGSLAKAMRSSSVSAAPCVIP